MIDKDLLLSEKDKFAAALNKAIKHIAKKKLSKIEALQYLDRGLLTGGRGITELLLAYLKENLICRPDEDYFNFAVDFIDTFYNPYYIEQYRKKNFNELETEWFTVLNSVILSYINSLKLVSECLAVLHALAVYSGEKGVTKKHFNSLCDVLSISSYPYILERIGLDNDSPAGEYFSLILESSGTRTGDTNTIAVEEKFYTYLENLKIPESELPAKLTEIISNSDSDYILDHISSYPDYAIKILTDLIPREKAKETVTFIADIEKSKRDEIRSVEKKYAARFASEILKRTGHPEKLTHETVENLNMIRTVQAISLSNMEETAEIFQKSAVEKDPVLSDIRHGFFIFTDLENLDDRSIQLILREVDSRDLTIALKGASPALLDAVFRNMSNRAASLLKEDMDFIGDVPERRTKTCRDLIQGIGNKLLRSGDIFMHFTGSR